MTYQVTLNSFYDGSTTFDATAAGVHVKDGPADGPGVITHMEVNDAGAIIDLDGTGPATLYPPRMTFNLIFAAAHPNAHAQYVNLETLKGKHGTLMVIVPSLTVDIYYSAPARLVDVRGRWNPPFKRATTSHIPVTVEFQLKDFLEAV